MVKTNLTWEECLEKQKQYIIPTQEYDKNWISMDVETPFEIMMLSLELKKKEEKVYNDLIKEYLLNNNK